MPAAPRLDHGFREFEGVERPTEAGLGIGDDRREPVGVAAALGPVDLVGAPQRVVGGQGRDEVQLGLQHAAAVKALDEEQVGQPGVGGDPVRGVDGAQLDAQLLGAVLQEPGHLVGRQAGHQRQPGLQRGEVVHGRGQQLGQSSNSSTPAAVIS